MMVTMMRRLRREEEGYSLVIAMLLLAIMAVLLVVGLDAGTASLKQSSLAVEWSRALTVAEAGMDDTITGLGENRNPTSTDLPHVRLDRLQQRGRPVPGELDADGRQDRRHVDRIRPDEDQPDVHPRGPGDVRAGAGVPLRALQPDRARHQERGHDSRATSTRMVKSPWVRTPRSAAASCRRPEASRSRTAARSSSPMRRSGVPGNRGRSGPAGPPGSWDPTGRDLG